MDDYLEGFFRGLIFMEVVIIVTVVGLASMVWGGVIVIAVSGLFS